MAESLAVVAHYYERQTGRGVYRRASTSRKQGQPLVLLTDAVKAISAAQNQPDWQSLKTVPDDGRMVMFWDEAYPCIRFGYCSLLHGQRSLVVHGASTNSHITHWAPMPLGPLI